MNIVIGQTCWSRYWSLQMRQYASVSSSCKTTSGMITLLLCAAVVAMMSSQAIATEADWPFITAREGKLYEGDREFRFISFNIPNLHNVEDAFAFDDPIPWRWPNEFEIEDALESVRQMGGTLVRTYVLSVYREGSDAGKHVYVLGPGEFNEEAFRTLDKVLEIAGQQRIRVLVPLVDNWHWWGFLMILFLTAMQSIPIELYDAAKIDGANRWQEFRYVTVPGIRPVILFMLMMSAIWAFLAFDYVWILTQGGPAGASDLMATVLYRNAFARFEAGYAAAQGLLLSALAGVIVVFFLYLRRRGWEI